MITNMLYSFIFSVLVLTSCCCLLRKEKHNCTYEEKQMMEDFFYERYPRHGDIPVLNRRVVKGKRTTIQEHPYVASIRRLTAHYLTGTIINNYLVLTVAHPLQGVPVSDLNVVVGESYNDRGTDLWTVILVLLHEAFDRHVLSADVALLRTYEAFVYKVSVKPIRPILSKDFSLEDKSVNAFVSGWGRCVPKPGDVCLPRSTIFHPNEFQDPMLKTITFPLKAINEGCQLYHQHGTPLSDGMLCVGESRSEFHGSSCLAVPGAPLVVEGHLLGILSWGFGCGFHTDLPLVYTDVRHFNNWIVDNSQLLINIDPYNFTHLFHATKAYTVIQWFNMTRKYKKEEHVHEKMEIQPWDLDRILVHLTGAMYDVRDFAFDGKYSNDKTRMYELIKAVSHNNMVSDFPENLPAYVDEDFEDENLSDLNQVEKDEEVSYED